jgi:cyclopropane fatty-acyl-phospholipid synthase-like methyltransferase
MNKGAALRRVWSASAPLELRWRLHQLVRAASAPLERVTDYLPERGAVLDLGCGHGVFLVLCKTRRPGLELVGIDVSAGKIDMARRMLAAADIPCELQVMDLCELRGRQVDVITVLDVMYLVPLEHWDAVLAACYACLKPGGVLLFKEMDASLRWKLSLLQLQEALTVRVLGWTRGEEGFSFVAPEEVERRLVRAGFSVEAIPMHRGYLAPHQLWRATKSVSS